MFENMTSTVPPTALVLGQHIQHHEFHRSDHKLSKVFPWSTEAVRDLPLNATFCALIAPPYQGCIGRGGGDPPPSRATVPLTPSASLNGMCNRQ